MKIKKDVIWYIIGITFLLITWGMLVYDIVDYINQTAFNMMAIDSLNMVAENAVELRDPDALSGMGDAITEILEEQSESSAPRDITWSACLAVFWTYYMARDQWKSN